MKLIPLTAELDQPTQRRGGKNSTRLRWKRTFPSRSRTVSVETSSRFEEIAAVAPSEGDAASRVKNPRFPSIVRWSAGRTRSACRARTSFWYSS